MGKKRDGYFFTEMVVGTVFTLVAASIWIELAKKMVNEYFRGDIKMMLLMASALTISSIFTLKYLFSDPSEKYKNLHKKVVTPTY
jgi:hypothetical protein